MTLELLNQLESSIALRALRDSAALDESFEFVGEELTVCSQDWDRRHPGGNYPKGLRRLTLRAQTEPEG